MRRPRNSRGYGLMPAQDPGKDLFAYLFLLIMVFAFMLLMSVDRQEQARKAPEQSQPGQSGLRRVSQENVAKLEKSQGKLWLRYSNVLYDPLTDFDRLVRDQRLVMDEDGEKQVLFIEGRHKESIFLHDYLETFSGLSRQGVTVAFAREVL